MKRIILTIIVMAFAVAVQADDTKACQNKEKDKDKAACCTSKVKVSDQAKGSCPFAKSECCKAKADSAKQQASLQSPKAADASK